MSKKIRRHKVFYDGNKASTNTYFYTKGGPKPWILTVRAKSTRQAKWAVYNGVVCKDMKMKDGYLQPVRGAGIGIVFVDHSWGPVEMLRRWPFPFDISEVGNNWEK